jgi:Mg2+ and Co2+ transporter CorA
MDATCFELTESGGLREVETADALQRWRAGDGSFWVDVKESSEPELEAMLDELKLGELLKRRLLRVGRGTSLIALRDVTFAEWTAFADEAHSRRAHVAALCLENLLVTLQTEAIEAPVEQSLDLSELGPVSLATVLCSLLFQQVTRTARAARELRDQLVELDQRMDDDPGSVGASELVQLKTDLLRAEAIAEEQAEAFRLLSEVQTGPLDFSPLKGPMSLLTSTADSTRRLNDRFDGRFIDLRRRAAEYKQDSLNQRLGFLTVISTVFLPLTLLAGIWGMNFANMPELKHPYGYPVSLGLMLLVAGGVVWSLRKRGWFD